jgi:hypothetical protein
MAIPVNKLCILAVGVALVSAPTATTAQTDRDLFAQRLLASARTVRCKFTFGTVTRLDSTPPKTDRRVLSDDRDIVFDQIDRQEHRAREIAHVGTTSVEVVASREALTFVEMPPLSGFPNVYTAFARLAPGASETVTADLLAVVSIHMIAGHEIIAVQDYGRCHVVPD